MEPLRYLDFDLALERHGDVYQAQVLRSPVGEATTSFTIPLSDDRLENLVLKMNPARGRVRGLASDELEAARELGGKLFESVFAGEVLACLRSSLDEAYRQDGVGLRLKLRLQEVGELSDLPWEYLFDRALGRFLAQSNYTPVVRYIELPQRIRPLAIALPLRILVMISSPQDPDYATLDVDGERRRLELALEPLTRDGRVEVEWLEKATLSELQRRLRTREYHIFHYVGHGGFDERAQEGVLVLEDEQGRGFRAPAYRLGPLLHDHRSLRLAVLNSCEGARNSRDNPFAGMATSLIRQGIPAVVAMQFEITDGAALTFAGDFYTALAEGLPVDAAVAEARKAILVQANDIEWGTPVLYMRAPDGVLFDVGPSLTPGIPATGAAAPLPPADAGVDAEPEEAGAETGQAVDVRPAEPERVTPPPEPEPVSPPPPPPVVAPVLGGMDLAASSGARRFRASAYVLALRNDGDAPLNLELSADDTVGACSFDMPRDVSVPARSTARVHILVRPKHRRIVGSSTRRPFTVVASGAGGGPPRTVGGEFEDLSFGWLPIAGGGFAAVAIAALLVPPLFEDEGGVVPPVETPITSTFDRIYFQSDRDGNSEIYAMNADGSDLRRLTNNNFRDILPHTNAKGAEITFASERDGNQEIYIMNADGSGQTRLTNNTGQDVEPDLSVDGSVAYEAIVGTSNYEIFVVRRGSTPVNISRGPAGEFDPTWSADGQLILFSSDRDGNVEIYIMHADGTNSVRVTHNTGDDFEPALSLDGTKIAFESYRDGNAEIYVMNRDGSNQRRLTNHPAEDNDPVWSADGKSIAFASKRTGNFEIYVMNADGSGLTNITNSPSNDEHPTWAWVTE